MKFTNIFIFICILSLLNSCQKNKKEPDNNKSNENNSEKYIPDSVLLNENYNDIQIPIYEYSSSSKDLLFKALKQYKDNDIKSALENIEAAIKMDPEGVYYYHYGVFLMDNKDYINAEKAFNMAENSMFLQEAFQGKKDIFTFDNNGLPREYYFTLYNLACVYSINMDLKKSLEYLINSIEQGYPYIDNIFSDVDLSNLFKSDDNIKTLIRNKFKNILAGRTFSREYESYYFVDDKNIIKQIGMTEARDYKFHGTYEIKNNNVYIHYNKETGKKGVIGTEIGAANVTIFSEYEDFSNDINRNEVISMPDMLLGIL